MNKRNLVVFDEQMIDPNKDKRIVNLLILVVLIQSKRDLFCAESISSRERQSQHKFKQSLLGAIQEPSNKITDFDSRQANVSRAK